MLKNVIPMNPQVKQEWVQELRSQKYKQGKFVMRRSPDCGDPEYCCLGVLSNIYAKQFGLEWVLPEGTDSFALEGGTAMAFISEEVRAWSQLEPAMEGQLSTLNDTDYNFSQIADIIEQEL